MGEKQTSSCNDCEPAVSDGRYEARREKYKGARRLRGGKHVFLACIDHGQRSFDRLINACGSGKQAEGVRRSEDRLVLDHAHACWKLRSLSGHVYPATHLGTASPYSAKSPLHTRSSPHTRIRRSKTYPQRREILPMSGSLLSISRRLPASGGDAVRCPTISMDVALERRGRGARRRLGCLPRDERSG